MKTFKQYIAESASNVEILDYLYCDALLNYDHWSDHNIRLKFLAYKNRNKDEKLVAHEFIDNEMSEEIRDDFFERNTYLNELKISGGIVNADAFISLLSYDTLGEPPFKFGKVFRLLINKATKLKSIPKWLPEQCAELWIYRSGLESLKGINNVVKECAIIDVQDCPVKSNILGIFQVSNLSQAILMPSRSVMSEDDREKLQNILDKHCQKSNDLTDRDLIEIQSDLIDAGFKEYAQL